VHEMGLAREILDVVRKHAAGRPVTCVVMEVGAFSGVNADALRFCTEALFSSETGRKPAVEVRRIPGRFACACGRVYESFEPLCACPDCGGFEREMTGGGDLRVISIEVED